MSESSTTELHNHWCCPGCDGGRPLTLADRQVITGRLILDYDEETGQSFCGDCLADLPAGVDALAHVCGDERSAPAGVEHKTRTFLQSPGREIKLHKRGMSPIYDRTALAQCTCGWSECWDDREMARAAARQHRERMAA